MYNNKLLMAVFFGCALLLSSSTLDVYGQSTPHEFNRALAFSGNGDNYS